METTIKIALKEHLLKLVDDLEKDEIDIQEKISKDCSKIVVNNVAYKLSPKEDKLETQVEDKQFYKDLGIKLINNLTCKENMYKLDYNEIYKYDVNAIIVTFGFFKVVILAREVLFKFDYDDNFIVGLNYCKVHKGWGGNTIELIDDSGYASSSGPFKDRLRISKCIYINTNKYSIDLEAQVVHLLKEYHHRCFYINDFNGKGKTYEDKDCNCFVCKRETGKIQMEPELEKVLIHDDDKKEEEVHYIPEPFSFMYKTLCGKKLNAIKHIRVKKLPVTCKKCISRSLLNSKYR